MSWQERYVEGWTRTMLQIWEERLTRLGVYDTGALLRSISGQAADDGAGGSTITFKFLEYGIYQEHGVGNGYRHDNGGYLHFLDKDYRRNRPGMGKARQKRKWMTPKLYMSVMSMKEDMARIIGKEAVYAIIGGLKL